MRLPGVVGGALLSSGLSDLVRLSARTTMRLPILVLLLRSAQPQFHAQTSIFVDDREVLITANLLHEDPLNVGKQACDELHIGEPQGELRDGRPRCATLIADELAESIFCNVSARGALEEAMREKGLEGPRGAFRFYHGTNYFDSEEYELLRQLFLRLGYVECLSGERMGGAEDAIWLLGHFDEHALFYANLAKHTMANALPNPQLLGTKDNLYRLLDRLRDVVGDRVTKFLPRTWLPDDIARERALSKSDRLGGLWLRKDPGQELGAGIKLITRWSELEGCANCILQRYVDRPFLLNDAAAGVVDAKFSFGVYISVSSLAPLEVWIHREMLVLLATYPYSGYGDSETDHGEDGDLLAHLTNGLVNQRLAGDAFDAAERVWTTDRLLKHLEQAGVAWSAIEDQIREAATMVFLASREPLLESRSKARTEGHLFCHWRLDFLLDADARAWLLEVEIVPSTGTIGGVDEVIKTSVLRDVLALNGVGGPPSQLEDEYPWLNGETWTDLASPAEPPNTLTPTPDAPLALFGDDAERMAAQEAWNLLEERGDALRFDAPSMEAIGRYEARIRRRGGYRPLIPVPRGVEGFDGKMRAPAPRDDDLARLFLSKGAIAADFALDRWVSTSPSAAEDAEPFVSYETLDAAATACRACDRTFCATVAARHPDVGVDGACRAATASCAHAPGGLVDGVPVKDCDFNLNDTSLARIALGARAPVASQVSKAIETWCDRTLRRAPYDADSASVHVRRLCRGTSRPRASIAEAKDIGEALLSKRPAVLRNVVKPFAEDLSRGPDDDATRVVAMAYDRARNAAQQIYSAPMTYGDFLAWSAEPELLDEATLPYGNTTALYLLVTDRHRFQPEASGTLADPNGAAMQDGPLPRLLQEADLASRAVLDGALGESGFDLAWTSLRLGSAYAYPTHVDCYENVIFQLRGRKNVTVYPPATVWDLQPDINHKHWPTGSPQEMARAARDAATVELQPGDALYVPLMWPHSVQSIDASVTSNKYLYVAEGWLGYINRAKTAPWLVYEMERGGLC